MSTALTTLWESQTEGKWQEALQALPCNLRLPKKPGLADLDRWLHDTLSQQMISASEPELTLEQLAKLMDWKLQRGSWRPRLLKLIESNDADKVQSISREAFLLIKEPSAPPVSSIKTSIITLSKLKGVGPATASAILSLVNKNLPFMSDEAIIASTGAKPEYSLKQYLDVVEALQAKAAGLTESGTSATPHEVACTACKKDFELLGLKP